MRAPSSRLARSLALLVLVSGTPALLAARADAVGDLDLSTASLTFGPATPGPGLTTRNVTVTNNGDTSAVVGSPSVTGADKGSFWASETCGGGSGGTKTLTPGQSCGITVTFAAPVPGARAGTLSIPNSVGPDLSVSLSASTLLPDIDVPVPSAFAATGLSDTRVKVVTVSSTGDVPLEIGRPGITGPDANQFGIIDDQCSLDHEIAAGDSCAIKVRFRPTNAGGKSATLSIPNNAGATATVPLTGSTGSPALASSPASLSFGSVVVGLSARSPVTVSNTGVGVLAWTSASLSGTNANQFAVDDTCRLAERITAGSCAVQVWFRPTATGTKTATLTLAASGLPTQTISLTGIGGATVKALSAAPSPINFGSNPVGATVGPSSLTITNTGNVPQVVSQDTFGIAPSTDFIVDYNCPLPLGPGDQCAALVWFRPSTTGSRTANLTVVGTGTTTVVPLSGSGVAGPPGLTLNPVSGLRQFGGVAVGATSGTLTHTITNSGAVPVTITGPVSVGGPSGSQFQIMTNTCTPGATLVPSGGSCAVGVRFAPTSPGLKAGPLQIPTSLGGPPVSFAINGIATRGYPQVTMYPVELNTARVGTSAGPQTITVTNSGNASMDVTAPTLIGTDPADFAITGGTCSGTTVAKNGTCDVVVDFTPTARGARSATLRVATTAGAISTVTLNGRGVGPTASADTGSLAYGAQPVDDQTAPLTVTITNNGDASLDIDAPSLTGSGAGQFSVWDDECSSVVVGPGDDCRVSVVFVPTTRGAKTATLNLATDAGAPIAIGLTGTGTQPGVTLNPTSRDFGSQAVGHPTAPYTYTVTNSGLDPLDVDGLTFGGSGAGSFDLMDSTCLGTTLSAGASCDISVRFDPTSAGSRSATLSLDHSGIFSPAVFALSGLGLAPVASVNPTTLPFGDQRVGQTSTPRSTTITNTGTAPLEIGATDLQDVTGDFDLTADDCAGATLAVGNACTMSVTYTPSSRGALTASIRVTTNAADSPSTIALSGTGIQPVAEPGPDAIDFGTVERGTATPTHLVDLANTGNADLVVSGVTLIGPDSDQFTIADDACTGETVASAASCAVDVRFTPTTLGAKTAQLRFTSNADGPVFVDLSGISVPKSDLKILGIGSVYTGRDHLVTRTVKTSGTVMKYKLGVTNEDTVAQSYKIRLTRSGALGTREVWSTGIGAHVLPTDGSGNFVTGVIQPAKTVTYELRVTPTDAGQVTTNVDVDLLSDLGATIEGLSTQTNTAAPVNGTSGFELFAGQGSQPLIGGPVNGQTVTGPALKVASAASYRVRLKNNSATSQQIGLRLTSVSCASAFALTVKAGAINITAAALAGTYVTPALGAGKYKDITISIKRTAAGCGSGLVRAQSLDGGTAVRTSYLLANSAYDAAVD